MLFFSNDGRTSAAVAATAGVWCSIWNAICSSRLPSSLSFFNSSSSCVRVCPQTDVFYITQTGCTCSLACVPETKCSSTAACASLTARDRLSFPSIVLLNCLLFSLPLPWLLLLLQLRQIVSSSGSSFPLLLFAATDSCLEDTTEE